MSHPDFPLSDKYGLIRSYTMATDFTIQAKQVEALLEKLEEKIENYRGMLLEQAAEKLIKEDKEPKVTRGWRS